MSIAAKPTAHACSSVSSSSSSADYPCNQAAAWACTQRVHDEAADMTHQTYVLSLTWSAK